MAVLLVIARGLVLLVAAPEYSPTTVATKRVGRTRQGEGNGEKWRRPLALQNLVTIPGPPRDSMSEAIALLHFLAPWNHVFHTPLFSTA